MFKSYDGKIFGRNENSLLFRGAPVGGSTPTGYGRGQTIFVDSNVAGSDGSSPSEALATIDAAINKCVANQGDVIVCLPGHSETITAAGAIACDVAGITVVGLGSGPQRATVLFGAATTA